MNSVLFVGILASLFVYTEAQGSKKQCEALIECLTDAIADHKRCDNISATILARWPPKRNENEQSIFTKSTRIVELQYARRDAKVKCLTQALTNTTIVTCDAKKRARCDELVATFSPRPKREADDDESAPTDEDLIIDEDDDDEEVQGQEIARRRRQLAETTTTTAAATTTSDPFVWYSTIYYPDYGTPSTAAPSTQAPTTQAPTTTTVASTQAPTTTTRATTTTVAGSNPDKNLRKQLKNEFKQCRRELSRRQSKCSALARCCSENRLCDWDFQQTPQFAEIAKLRRQIEIERRKTACPTTKPPKNSATTPRPRAK